MLMMEVIFTCSDYLCRSDKKEAGGDYDVMYLPSWIRCNII